MERVTSNKSPNPMSQSSKDCQKRYYEKNKQKIIEKRMEYNKMHKDITRKAQKIL